MQRIESQNNFHLAHFAAHGFGRRITVIKLFILVIQTGDLYHFKGKKSRTNLEHIQFLTSIASAAAATYL